MNKKNMLIVGLLFSSMFACGMGSRLGGQLFRTPVVKKMSTYNLRRFSSSCAPKGFFNAVSGKTAFSPSNRLHTIFKRSFSEQYQTTYKNVNISFHPPFKLKLFAYPYFCYRLLRFPILLSSLGYLGYKVHQIEKKLEKNS